MENIQLEMQLEKRQVINEDLSIFRVYGRENFADAWLRRWSSSGWPLGCTVDCQPLRFRIKSSRNQRKNNSKRIRLGVLKVKAKFLLVVSMRCKQSVASAEDRWYLYAYTNVYLCIYQYIFKHSIYKQTYIFIKKNNTRPRAASNDNSIRCGRATTGRGSTAARTTQ